MKANAAAAAPAVLTAKAVIPKRKICKEQNSSAYYREAVKIRSAETIANIALVMLHQEDYLLKCLFEKLKRDFMENGGIKEEIYQIRRELRKK